MGIVGEMDAGSENFVFCKGMKDFFVDDDDVVVDVFNVLFYNG